MAAPIYYTADMVRALPDDGNRYEVVRGELLVTPASRPWHQVVLYRLTMALGQYAEKHAVGQVLGSPADISWGPDTLVQPDLFVARLDEIRTLRWEGVKNLLLAIEVLSPTTARSDRFAKRRLYQEVGIPLYWIVDPDERAVEVWTPQAAFPDVERERLVWHPQGPATPFTLALPELFRPL